MLLARSVFGKKTLCALLSTGGLLGFALTFVRSRQKPLRDTHLRSIRSELPLSEIERFDERRLGVSKARKEIVGGAERIEGADVRNGERGLVHARDRDGTLQKGLGLRKAIQFRIDIGESSEGVG